jgi:hypothetical protein
VRIGISWTTKDKSCLDLSFQYGAKRINVSLSILFISEFEERGIRRKKCHRECSRSRLGEMQERAEWILGGGPCEGATIHQVDAEGH